MTFFSRKHLRLLLLPALLLLTGLLSAALTGCGGGSTEQASEDGQTADGSTEARAQANEIVVGIAAAQTPEWKTPMNRRSSTMLVSDEITR